MKFSDIRSWEAILLQRKSSLYILMVPDPYERKKRIEALLLVLSQKEPFFLSRFSAEKDPLSEGFKALSSPSLFGERPLVVFDEIEDWKKKDFDSLSSFARNGFWGVLILAAGKKLALPSSLEQKGQLLDLTQEKPWEKKGRLAHSIQEAFSKENKTLSPQALALLFEKTGMEMAALEREKEKLSLFVGERANIEVEDVEKVCSLHLQESAWKVAEEIAFGEKRVCLREAPLQDPSFFPLFFAALRYLLHQGLQWNGSQEEGSSYDSKAIEKKKAIARRRGELFFQKALEHLFSWELSSRDSSVSSKLLFEVFQEKIRKLI